MESETKRDGKTVHGASGAGAGDGEGGAEEDRAGRPATLKGLPFVMKDNPLYLMTRAIDRVARNVEAALGAHRFSQTHWRTLVALAENEPLSIGELSDFTFVEGSAQGRAIAKMEADGLVRREHDPADRRIVRVVLTPAGWARLDELKPVVVGEIDRAIENLSRADLRQLIGYLHDIADTAQAAHDRPETAPRDAKRAASETPR